MKLCLNLFYTILFNLIFFVLINSVSLFIVQGTIDLWSLTFWALWTGGREECFCLSGKCMHSSICVNGGYLLCMRVSDCLANGTMRARSPTACTAQFWMGFSPVLGRSPRVVGPCPSSTCINRMPLLLWPIAMDCD